jgi:ketosteroid isomerase-like protein
VVSQRVDTVRKVCQAWGARDISTLHDLYALDVVADAGELWPEGTGSVHGVEAVMGAFESIMSAFDSSELVPEGFLETGDTLVIPLLWRGRSEGSQSFVEQRLVAAYGFRGRLIAEMRWFPSLERALGALGLAPEDAAAMIPEPAYRQG